MSYIKSKFVKSILVFVMFFGFSFIIFASVLYSQPDNTTELPGNTLTSSQFTGIVGHPEEVRISYNDMGNSTGHYIGVGIIDATLGITYYGYNPDVSTSCGNTYQSTGLNQKQILSFDTNWEWRTYPCTGENLTFDSTHTYYVSSFRNQGGLNTQKYYGSPTSVPYLYISNDTDINDSTKSITAFSFPSLSVGTIDQTTRTITITVPFGTDISSITPDIQVSDGASFTPNTPQNFKNHITYTVTAADNSSQTYKVKVLTDCGSNCLQTTLYSQTDSSIEISSPNISSFPIFTGASGSISKLEFAYNDHGNSTGHWIGVSVVDLDLGINYYADTGDSCGNSYQSTGSNSKVIVTLDSSTSYRTYPCTGANLVLDPTHTYGVALFRNTGGSNSQRFYGLSNTNDGVYLVVEGRKSVDIIDSTKPVTVPSVAGTLGTNDWYTSNATLSLSATDDVSGVASTEYSLNTGISWIPYTTPVTFIDGIHTVLYRSTDTIGNIEDTQTIIIKVDTSLPVSAHNINGTLGLEDWYVSDAELVLNATDTNSDVFEINYSLDGGITWNVYNTPLSFSDGEYTVFYRAIDLAGNTENDHIVDVKVDTVKPVTTPVVGGDEGVGGWRVSSATLDFTATDDVSSVSNIEYSLDFGSTWNIYSTQLVFGSGTHTVWYRAHDVAGNVEDYQTMVNMVDSNVPVTSVLIEGVLGNEDWYTTSPMISFTAVSEPSGVANTQYSLDSGVTWNMYSTAFALFDGTHSVFYKSTNNAGTVEPVQTVNINVDTSLPTSTHTINGVAGANSWYKSDAVIALTSTDSFSGVLKTEYSLDGGATWILYEGEISLTDDGIKSILYRAIDNAGNTGADNTITLKIDTEAPEASILFDEVTKQVTFVGIDENPTTAVTGANSSLITDEAGHTLLVEFTKLSASSNSNNKTGIQINKLTYDGVANSGIGKRVVIRYLWHTDSSGEFTNLRGRAVDGRFVEISRYRPNLDITRIIEKTRKASCAGDCEDNEYFEEDDENCDDRPKTVRTTVSGLVVVGFETNNGNVSVVQNNY